MFSKKYLIIYLFLALIPIIILAIEYPSLPEMVAVRNNGRSPEDFENKIQLWLLPIMTVLFAILGIFIPKLDRKKLMNANNNISQKVFMFVLMMCNIVFAIELNMATGAISNVNYGLVVMAVCILPIIFIIVIGLIESKRKI